MGQNKILQQKPCVELLLSRIFCNKVSIGAHNGIQPADVALCRLLDTLRVLVARGSDGDLARSQGGENFDHGPGRKARFLGKGGQRGTTLSALLSTCSWPSGTLVGLLPALLARILGQGR